MKHSPPDLLKYNDGQAAPQILFVSAQKRTQLACVPLPFGGKAKGAQQRGNALLCAVGSLSPRLRKPGNGHHADAHRLSMAMSGIVLGPFDGMADRMPKIEQHALAVVLLVGLDDRPLDFTAARNNLFNFFHRPPARVLVLRTGAEQIKQRRIPDTSRFDDLGQPVGKKVVG